jgi:hypothetical protein
MAVVVAVISSVCHGRCSHHGRGRVVTAIIVGVIVAMLSWLSQPSWPLLLQSSQPCCHGHRGCRGHVVMAVVVAVVTTIVVMVVVAIIVAVVTAVLS